MAVLELSSRLFRDIIKHPALGAALGILSFIKSPSIPHPREKTLGQITGDARPPPLGLNIDWWP